MRKLNLKKETLVELSTDELAGVDGASFPSKYACTESYQVCISEEICHVVERLWAATPTIGRPCIPTQGC